jgi:hypothetical protein
MSEVEMDSLRAQVRTRAAATSAAHTTADTVRARPADALLELGRRVDLLVIGSCSSGTSGRILRTAA